LVINDEDSLLWGFILEFSYSLYNLESKDLD